MELISLDVIQKLGGHLLSDGKLYFQDQVFIRGGAFPESSQKFVASMVEQYQSANIKYLLVHSAGMITIWRSEKKTDIIPKTDRPPSVTIPSKKYTIVHVDDSLTESKIMCKILTDLGLNFNQINNAMLAVANSLRIKPDLIFLDLNMPIVNGYEICAQLRRVDMFKETPIVIVTANDGLVDRVRAKMSGASDFVSKPIDRAKIITILQKHLSIN